MKLNKKRWGNAKVQITKIWLTNQDNERRNIFITGDYMRIHVEYQANIQIEKPVIGVGFWTLSGQRFYGSNTQMDNVMDIGMEAGEKGYFIYDIEKIPFLTGEYQLEVAIEDLLTCEQLDYWLDALRFQVNSATREIGISKVEHKWIFEKIKEGAEDDGQHNINDN